MNKQIYRCVVSYSPPFKQVAGNMFLRATSKEQAIADAKEVMNDVLKQHGFVDVIYNVEAFLSSEDEVLHYKTAMKTNPTVDKMVN